MIGLRIYGPIDSVSDPLWILAFLTIFNGRSAARLSLEITLPLYYLKYLTVLTSQPIAHQLFYAPIWPTCRSAFIMISLILFIYSTANDNCWRGMRHNYM